MKKDFIEYIILTVAQFIQPYFISFMINQGFLYIKKCIIKIWKEKIRPDKKHSDRTKNKRKLIQLRLIDLSKKKGGFHFTLLDIKIEYKRK